MRRKTRCEGEILRFRLDLVTQCSKVFAEIAGHEF